jgi:anti-sigma-K factor RskA
MRHDQPELIDALASEYVLGTLRGAARRRFERWRAESWHIASRVQTWEGRLMPLAFGLPPVTPGPEVWRAIEARIRAGEGSRAAPLRRPALRALAAAIVLCVIAAGGYFAWRVNAPQLHSVAVIKAAQGADVWSIELDAHGAELRAIALAGAAARPGHSFELWALAAEAGGAPISLGVLPTAGQLERTLSAGQQAALAHALKIAVTLEPPGGSPSGAPTGPVVFVADLKKSA